MATGFGVAAVLAGRMGYSTFGCSPVRVPLWSSFHSPQKGIIDVWRGVAKVPTWQPHMDKPNRCERGPSQGEGGASQACQGYDKNKFLPAMIFTKQMLKEVNK